MSDYEAMDQTESDDDDLWHVQLRNGEVCMMTLEQLDDAFQEGVISENTYLWQEGATGWVTLREVAGLDSDGDTATMQANPFVQPDHASDSVWPSAPAAPAYASAQDIYAPPLQNMGPHSTAPVVSPYGMDLDLETVDFGKKKRSGGKWLVAAALIGAAGFGATKYKMLPIPDIGNAPSVNAQALTAARAIPVEATPLPAAAPPPAAAPAPAPQPETVPAKANLDNEVKERLAKADKALAEKQKSKQQHLQQRHSVSSRSSRPRTSPGEKVFHKGGEVGDPLNSAL